MIVTRKSLDIPSGTPPCCSSSMLSIASDESDGSTSLDAESPNDAFSNSPFSPGSADIMADGISFLDDLALPNMDLTTIDHGIDAVISSDSPPTTDVAPTLDRDYFQWYGTQDASSSPGIFSEAFAEILSTQQLQLTATGTDNDKSPSPRQNEEDCFPQGPVANPGQNADYENPDAAKSPRYIIRLDEATHETILVVMNILIKSKARVRFEAA